MPRITKTGALKISLIAISSVIVVEGLAGSLIGSLALMSDAAHASFDTFSTLILLVATSLSLKPADEDHTYGHGKIESIGALIGGFILLLLAIGIAVLAFLRLNAGNTVHPSLVGYGAAGYTLAIDVLRMVVLRAALKTGSLSIKADLYHALSDFFSTALVFVALGLTSIGLPVGDTAVSLVLATMLGFLSFRLIYSSSRDLSDAVSGKLVQSILGVIRGTEEVLKCKELRVRRVGEITYVDAVIAVSPYAGVADADSIAGRIEVSLSKLLGKSSVLIHIEPLEWGVPVEMKIRNATGKVDGAIGLHNLTIAHVGEGLYVTLHVQVDPSLPLGKAHEIAESVQRGIESSVPDVRHVTVHIEPSLPVRTSAEIVDDQHAYDTVRTTIQSYPEVREVRSILIYTTGDKLHINVHCLFAPEESITTIHGKVSKIEESIRRKFENAVVTIRPEPYSS